MSAQNRLWDSSVIIGYLVGRQELADPCGDIVKMAEQGGGTNLCFSYGNV